MADPALPCNERLLAAVAAALEGLTLDGVPVTVERDRTDTVSERDMPRLVVYEGAAECDQTFVGGTDVWTMTVEVAGYVRVAPPPASDRVAARSAAGLAASTAAARLKAAVHGRLFSPNPSGDLALAETLRPSGQPPPDRLALFAADPARAFTLLVDVEFDTPTGDPTTFL